jgi:hypothetical protein
MGGWRKLAKSACLGLLEGVPDPKELETDRKELSMVEKLSTAHEAPVEILYSLPPFFLRYLLQFAHQFPKLRVGWRTTQSLQKSHSDHAFGILCQSGHRLIDHTTGLR